MAMPNYDSVDAYLAAQPADLRRTLSQVRAAIRKALPKANETISYKIPTYELGGKAVVFFAAWKRHYSLYPITPAIQRALRSELAQLEVEKGTVRLPFDAPVPSNLIARIAKLRAAEAPRPPTKAPRKSAKTPRPAKRKSGKRRTPARRI